jgi:glutaminase
MNTNSTYHELVQKAVSLMKNGQVADYIKTLIALHGLKQTVIAIRTEEQNQLI